MSSPGAGLTFLALSLKSSSAAPAQRLLFVFRVTKASASRSALDGLTTAVTGPPPKHFDFKTRVIGGSGSPLGYPAIRGGSFDGSPLPTHHFLDPDRGEG